MKKTGSHLQIGLEEHRAFEGLICDLLARFLNAPESDLDSEIVAAIRRIAEFLGLDQGLLVQWGNDAARPVPTHSWTVPWGLQPPVSPAADVVPWVHHHFVLGKIVMFSAVDDLPQEAEKDREFFRASGRKALISLPLKIGGDAVGALVFASLSAERDWPDEVVRRLQLIADVFAGVLHRNKSRLQVERKEAEAARTDSMERYRAMVEAYDGYIYICAPDNRIEFMNRHLIDRTGRDATGELCYRALHDLDSVCPWCVNDRVFAGETVRWEVQSPKDHRWYYVVNTPIRRADRVISKQSIIMDITDRKAAEEEIKRAYEEINNLKNRLEAENIYLREEINRAWEFEDIIGQSDALKYVFFRIQQVAPTNSTVLITGETGTGKGLAARAVHGASQRRDRQMIIINCAALPASLIESELFGREKGAFTGAHTSQAGRFELADKGTIFLDEIGELPLELQAKLLRVIEHGEFERLGSSRTIKVDVRIIASTNRDLDEETQEGRFREDLFYRLNVFPVTMPPLRQRKDDISLLVLHFVKKHGKKMGKDITEIPLKVMKALEEFPWPGNVRELENIVERAVITTEGHVLELAEPVSAALLPSAQNSPGGLSDVEREHILKTLQQTFWRIEGQNGAARLLGLKPSTLRSRMKKLGIQKTKNG
jgi:formate hydrogenlyase transcriptional activator